MDKKTNITQDKLLPRLIKSTVFKRLVKEVDAYEIPPKYIEKIIVSYFNGTVVDLVGDQISKPVPVNREESWEDIGKMYKNIEEVKVFINTEQLETDINERMEELFKKYSI